MKHYALGCAMALGLSASAALADAHSEDTLTMGLSVSPSSFDPQLGALGSDETYYSHVYDALFMRSPNLQPVPKLATGYTLIDDLTWEIDLREGVKFHDGSDFDAEDVVYTIDRLPTVEGSDGLNTEKMDAIESIEVINPHKIRVRTKMPVPNMITQFFTIFMLPSELGEVTTAQFNSGEAAIGTGPYKFVEWKQGEQVVLERNEDYFDEKPLFENVIIREMPNAGSRVAALLAGDVDFIDDVPPLDVRRLREAENVNVAAGPSARVIFIQLNMADQHPLVTAKDGSPLDSNPLANAEVRAALNMAVDRELIVNRVMDDLAVAASQAVPEGFLGYAEDVDLVEADTEAARAKLADAGYPDGFAMTLSCPNDRYVNDEQVCQGLGQMFSRIGVETKVDTMPKSAYFGPLREGAFAAWMLGWGNSQGHAGSVLPSVFRSGGSWNGGTSIPAADPQIDDALAIMDTEKRGAALAEAMKILADETAYIPLHAQAVVTAVRDGLTYQVMADETALAMNLSKVE